jgi:hypothetical protein
VKILADYQGQSVRLTDERWRHIVGHPEMAGLERAMEETLREPELVVRSASDPSAALNYRYYRRTLIGDKWLCVVVKYGANEPFVLTAYLTDKPKKGDVLWHKQ